MSSLPDQAAKPRGRPALFDRDRVLDELVLLMWRRGYAAATQEEMLAVTGLSSSTLYRSFGTKADILRSALERYLAWSDQMFAPLEQGHKGVQDVCAFLAHLRALLDGPMRTAGCLVWNTTQDPINSDPQIKALTDQHMQRLHHGLTAALRRAADAGQLPPSTTTHLANTLRAGVLGIQARARANDLTDAIAMLHGLQAIMETLTQTR
ncbi:MAG TPA: TetR/AcrR family transcriptional regulator [Solirubrobacteraceae bacterium]|nr:TetR/AcrR family transcriptional regulator [Solirubrobacteraceae bacterium]